MNQTQLLTAFILGKEDGRASSLHIQGDKLISCGAAVISFHEPHDEYGSFWVNSTARGQVESHTIRFRRILHQEKFRPNGAHKKKNGFHYHQFVPDRYWQPDPNAIRKTERAIRDIPLKIFQAGRAEANTWYYWAIYEGLDRWSHFNVEKGALYFPLCGIPLHFERDGDIVYLEYLLSYNHRIHRTVFNQATGTHYIGREVDDRRRTKRSLKAFFQQNYEEYEWKELLGMIERDQYHRMQGLVTYNELKAQVDRAARNLEEDMIICN